METIGKRIRRLRQERGLSTVALATLARIHHKNLNHIEADKHGTNFFTIIELARHLGVSIDYIAYGRDYEKRSNDNSGK
jgi:transcriptional regulator with XRE-family HTH domain